MCQQYKTSICIFNVSFLCSLLSLYVLSIMLWASIKDDNIEEVDFSSLGTKNYAGFCPTVENISPSVQMETLLSSLDRLLTPITESLVQTGNWVIIIIFEPLKIAIWKRTRDTCINFDREHQRNSWCWWLLSIGNGGQGRWWETFAFQMTPLKTFFYYHGFHSEWLRVTVLEPRLWGFKSHFTTYWLSFPGKVHSIYQTLILQLTCARHSCEHFLTYYY